MQKLADLLKSRNIKVTPQRLAIYNVLYQTTEHPSAEKIYQQLLPSHPTMSLATIYKTLDALKKVHLVTELNTGGDSFRYDAKMSSHPHAICLECGDVYDLHTELLNHLSDQVQAETDFNIAYHQVYFYGKCKKCQ
ncbi:MAG: transcriptional repressor [Vallitaleaceae bacterium]|nr:transcriptional repressor [Vallitaleaceae bacterium]